MKTIRGKIIVFFALCLAFAGVLALMYYQGASTLREKIYAIERFDDLLNDVLELRRYEKNIIFYHDPSSLKEAIVYLQKIDNDFDNLKEGIVPIVGTVEYEKFKRNLEKYKQTFDIITAAKGTGATQDQEEDLRAKGKSLVDFSILLIQKKRHRIDQTLKRVLIIPFASLGFLIVLVFVISYFIITGILKPLQVLESATEQVARESFIPIPYGKGKQDEITRLIASFNKMVAELDSRQEQLVQSRKLASIGTFTSGIAHELNNPLNNISITAEAMMLRNGENWPEDIVEMIDDIMTQADRASQVVKNLLEFSRTERPSLKNLDIRAVLDRTLSFIKNQLVVANVRIEQAFAPDLPEIRGKQQDLQQAFVNILLNAIQAMPDGGTITIRADQGPEGYLRIDMSDTGTGIKAGALEHIFDPFYTTKASSQGTGLGLSIVYSIIRTHGGYIEAKSAVGQGTTFSIYLPITTGKEDNKDEVQNSGG
ncbi:MAG: HAMP domain-containing protein [Proteobacteria bacterium]|nr:HAMP domain-containing protein [Pseudomonadota bacterium]